MSFVTDTDGISSFTFRLKRKVAAGQFVTATATSSFDGTSGFLAPRKVEGYWSPLQDFLPSRTSWSGSLRLGPEFCTCGSASASGFVVSACHLPRTPFARTFARSTQPNSGTCPHEGSIGLPRSRYVMNSLYEALGEKEDVSNIERRSLEDGCAR